MENKPKRGRRWTPEARKKQSGLSQQQKPWLHATGPRTAAGKARSSRNAVKHGFYTGKYLEFQKVLQLHRRFLARLNKTIRLAKKQIRAEKFAEKEKNWKNELVIPADAARRKRLHKFFRSHLQPFDLRAEGAPRSPFVPAFLSKNGKAGDAAQNLPSWMKDMLLE
jgi:hypothetical protein